MTTGNSGKRGTLTRRQVIRGLGGAAAVAGLPLVTGSRSASAFQAEEAGYDWSNGSGSVTCTAREVARPRSVDDVIAAVRAAERAGHGIRVVGSGHSFTPLGATDGTIVVLGRLRGVEDIDSEKREATVLAGSKLYHLGKPLLDAGLALENMPDIDRQAIAGAIATGTHGTGETLGSLSTQVIGMRLVIASGEVIEISEREPDLLRAAQVSLGALGVVTHVRLRLLPAYRLHEKTRTASYEECTDTLASRIAENRHFEFFWVSGRDACMKKTLNTTAIEADSETSDTRTLSGERIGPAHEIFPSARNTPFNEIAYSVPAEEGPDCLSELRELMLGKHKAITWPLEYRTVAADDIFLS
ncbi:MAG: FAD-binding protein, partial [Acidobacteria bacterium]|nr:FAD-binding protein [Acidobacteriota bacterium]